MDRKLEARITRLERMLKRESEDYIDPADLERAEEFELEMNSLLRRYNAVIKRMADDSVCAVERGPRGVILMTF